MIANTKMPKSADDWSRVKTAERAFDIVEFLAERNGGDLATIADELDLAKSTVHRHLGTLSERGYIVKEDREFQLSLRFAKLGERALKRKDAYVLAKSKVDELAAETGERVQFVVEEHGYAVYAYVARGDHAVRTDPGAGSRIPIHTAAAGKAILAHLPEEDVERIVDRHGLPAETGNTITSLDELWDELETIRERGFAYNNQEAIEGLLAIGAPVVEPNGDVIGALSISGPTHRMNAKIDDELAELLLGTTNELELNIGYA